MRTIEGIKKYLEEVSLIALCNDLHDAITTQSIYVSISGDGVSSSNAASTIDSMYVPTTELVKMFESPDIRQELINYFNTNVSSIKSLYKNCMHLV